MKTNRGFTLLELAVALGIIAILASGIFLGVRQNHRRHITNASLQLQADLRYVQRRAIMEGQRFGIIFEPHLNHYWLVYIDSANRTTRIYEDPIRLENRVRLHNVVFPNNRIYFTPRGTPSRGGSLFLRVGPGNGIYEQRITVNPSGGRAFVDFDNITTIRQH